MVRVSPSFERVARRLTTLQLRAHANDEDLLAPDDTFVGAYSVDGIRTVLEEYGLQRKLEERGLGDVQIGIEREDAYRHRLELHLPTGEQVMDLRLHLCTVHMPHEPEGAPGLDVVAVDWLRMQNPRAQFTPERPALPGQVHPGTGLGRDVAQLLVLLCRRIGRHALVAVPERFHLAELYAQGGYVAASAVDDEELAAVLRATSSLGFVERAWAVERGEVRDAATGAAYAYAPHERILVVGDGVSFRPAPASRAPRRFRLDPAARVV